METLNDNDTFGSIGEEFLLFYARELVIKYSLPGPDRDCKFVRNVLVDQRARIDKRIEEERVRR